MWKPTIQLPKKQRVWKLKKTSEQSDIQSKVASFSLLSKMLVAVGLNAFIDLTHLKKIYSLQYP